MGALLGLHHERAGDASPASLRRHCYIQNMYFVVHQPEDDEPQHQLGGGLSRHGQRRERLHRDQDRAPVVLQLAPEELSRPGMAKGPLLDDHHLVEIVGPHPANLELVARPDGHQPPFPTLTAGSWSRVSSTRTVARLRRSDNKSCRSRWYFSCASFSRSSSRSVGFSLRAPLAATSSLSRNCAASLRRLSR